MATTSSCAICLEDIKDKNTATMECGHTFHFKCITSNILKSIGDNSMNCPMCRQLIVDDEFENHKCEIYSDTDSLPPLDENRDINDLWDGTQIWRRYLSVGNKIILNVDTHTKDILNRLGWECSAEQSHYLNIDDAHHRLECKIVCIIPDPIDALCPFLVKPDKDNAITVQAYQPRQLEIHEITTLNYDSDYEGSVYGGAGRGGFASSSSDEEDEEDNDGGGRGGFASSSSDEEDDEEEDEEALRASRILKRQIHHKPIHEITDIINEKLKNIVMQEMYHASSVRSIIHKTVLDIILDHRHEQQQDLIRECDCSHAVEDAINIGRVTVRVPVNERIE